MRHRENRRRQEAMTWLLQLPNRLEVEDAADMEMHYDDYLKALVLESAEHGFAGLAEILGEDEALDVVRPVLEVLADREAAESEAGDFSRADRFAQMLYYLSPGGDDSDDDIEPELSF